MKTPSLLAKEYFSTLNILYAALMLGQILFVGVIYFVVNVNREPLEGVAATGQSWVYIVGGLTIALVLVSAQVFGMQLKKLREMPDFTSKLQGYRTALLTRYTLLELPSLAAIIGYYLTNNLLLLIFSAMILLLFLTYRPSKERLVADLDLSPAEQAQLNDLP